MSDIQDFTDTAREPIKFKIDDDVFEAVPSVGANVLRDVISMAELTEVSELSSDALSPEQRREVSNTAARTVERALTFLDLVLLEDSAARFANRMRSTVEPITIQQAFQVWQWLIQRYSSHPTQPSSPSLNGHGGTGTSSTVGAPVGA